MLTFEFDKENELLEIHGDSDDFIKLAELINSLAKAPPPEHIHLMSPDWGGDFLGNEQQCDENELIHHVKLMLWSKN